jgi:hypothetical protein
MVLARTYAYSTRLSKGKPLNEQLTLATGAEVPLECHKF